MTETELLDGLMQKDQKAFRSLVEKYQDQVFRTSLALVKNVEDAEDITQDVFIEVYQSITKFRGDSLLSTWIYRVTINKSINLIRKNKRKDSFISFSDLFKSKKDKEITVETPLSYTATPSLENDEKSRILKKAILSLPENQRIAFTLHKIEELPHKEIARIMDSSVSSVESLIFRAKQTLQKKLIHYYKTSG